MARSAHAPRRPPTARVSGLLARNAESDDGPGVLISVVDPGRTPTGELEVSGDAPGEGVPAPLEHPRLVSEIIEKMGGQIATVSEPPVGRVTAIWLRRPRA